MSPPFTVLFVEDDAGVRESTAALLAHHGVRLFVARDGYEALDVIAQEHVDVLFTDVVMPDLNGIDLAKRALGHQPDLKVIFMTASTRARVRLSDLANCCSSPFARVSSKQNWTRCWRRADFLKRRSLAIREVTP
jgi:CheY-like chemotaxis protein